MKKFKKVISVFTSIALHFVAGGLIYYFWKPIVQWYWSYRPVLGVDFYNLATYVSFLARHFVFRFNGWKYIWWGGGPLFLDYPTLHAYLILPLLRFFGLIQAIQIYMLASCFLFLFFSYLLFVEISKDRVLAVILTIASSFSIALYGALVWGGSLPYFASQFFLPLVLWVLVKFLNTANERWFYLSSLLLGVSLFGHPQVGASFIIPISFLLLFTHPVLGARLFNRGRIKHIFIFFLIALLVGYPAIFSSIGKSPAEILNTFPKVFREVFVLRLTQIFELFGQLFKSKQASSSTFETSQAGSGQTDAFAEYHRGQLLRFITDTNGLFLPLLVVAVIIFILSFLLRKKKMDCQKVIIFTLPVAWTVFYNLLFAFGISIFHGGWYRVFWPFPLILGMLISSVWGDFWVSIKERFVVLQKKFIWKAALTVLGSIIVFFAGYYLLEQNSAKKMLDEIEYAGYRQQSSAFPDSLNIYIEEEEWNQLKERVTPSWFDPGDTWYRLFDPDQRVNIWWSTFFDIPLVKGYVELPPGDVFTGVFYWSSIALTQTGNENTLVESWGVPEEMAYNNALFLIDWFSIKYIEAGHAGTDSYNPIASYLVENDVFENQEEVVIPGWAQLYDLKDQKRIKIHPEVKQYLSYYEIKDDFVSPIAHPTNASTVGVIGRLESYNTLIRCLGAVNLNSRRVIPVRLGKFIDNVSFESLKDMDAIVLYGYDYKNHGKVWAKLEKYVEEGGKVFIETGDEVKQTDSINLPTKYSKELPVIFPIEMTRQEEMGTEWQLIGGSQETEGLNLEAFGLPVIEDEPWLFSQPSSAEGLREGARVILSNKDVPLIVSWKYGEGEVIWSGMNLPYHLTTHKSMEEARLFQNLLENFVTTTPVPYSGFEAKRESATKVVVQGTDAEGVLFRENSNPGWAAKLKSGPPAGEAGGKSQKLKVYQTGPTYYGFSYVKIPKEAQESFTVTFIYQGEFWVYFWYFVSLATSTVVFDRVVFGSRLVIPIFRKILAPFKKRLGGWWEKEGEY